MIIYYTIFIFISGLSIFHEKIKGPLNIILIFIVFVALLLLSGFRYNEFGDYCTYNFLWNDSPNLVEYFYLTREYIFYTEKLFTFIIFASKLFLDQPIGMFVTIAFLSLSINFYALKKISPNVYLSLLIYFSHIFFYKEMAQIRFGLSSALVLLSFYYLANTNTIRYFGVVLIAISIHITALPAVAVYIFSKFKFSRSHFIIFFIIAIFLGLISFGTIFLNFLESLDLLPHRYYVYKYYDPVMGSWAAAPNDIAGVFEEGSEIVVNVNNQDIGIFSNPTTLKNIAITIFSIIFFKLLNNRHKYFYVSFCAYFLGTCWIIIFNDYAIIASRVASFLTVSELVLIPMFISVFANKKTVNLVVILFPFLLLNYNIYYQKNIPAYETIFNQAKGGSNTYVDCNVIKEGSDVHTVEHYFLNKRYGEF